MIYIAICDDEKHMSAHIRSCVSDFFRKKNRETSLRMFSSGEELLSYNGQIDILFLDIQMSGRNGIDTARLLRQRSEHMVIVFVSGIKDYVFQAFDVAAFHYLLKPLEKEKFEEVLDRALREAEKHRRDEAGFLLVKTRNRTVSVPKSGIFYVESRGKKAEVHTGKDAVEMYASLNGLEAELGAGFYRCHRGYLVNMAYVSEYYHDRILLTNGETIYLAKEKYSEFVKEYMRYLKGGGVSYG